MTTSRSIGTTRKPGTTAVFDEDHSPRLLRETNAWDIYNNEARKVDNELVKDWTATLNSLLVFAAIFSAVLAAFIIESKKLLEQDYSEAMYDAMVFYMGNLANGTFTPYQRAEFEPSSTAISVNSLFFGSLSASLVAAFASVVVLQWVADFDAVVTRSESLPIEKARRRHFRFTGVENWRMGEIIAALPLILYFSVALFLAGIIQWMLYLHKTVAYVVIAGAILTALFYFSSTLLAVVFISAPYKSPLSRWIYSMYCYPFTLIYRIIKAIRIRRVPRWISAGRQDYQLAHKREDLMVAQMTDLDLQAVEWLIRQVSISDPWHRVVILVGEIARLENERFDVDGFIRSPWIQILNKLFFQSIRGQWRVTREMGHSTEGVSRLLYFKQDLLDATLTRQDIRHFKAKWSDFDREMTGYIRIEYVVRFLVRLSGTLGFGDPSISVN
ncbi:hypothetical protein M408DRAFT_213381 [Serendipita vermifera MAFF 305830]|uniref:DUF6535 domain-containing protein n=1 Tax=Serendipita vermifera MAFF 305830 TaxID=933852 RepID=A0A0C3B5K3_SERVB|nr:hypothetical protein M408DRAFT_213381 [Serendipita vermifera MAFF 305830]